MMHCFSVVISDSSWFSAEKAIEYEIGMFCCISDTNKIAEWCGKTDTKKYVAYTSPGLVNKYTNHHDKCI